jgi:hypothetical protein
VLRFPPHRQADKRYASPKKIKNSDKTKGQRDKRNCQRTNGTFAKLHKPTHDPSFAKEPFFAIARL